MARCRWAIKFGHTLHTRCMLQADQHREHTGKGLKEFPYQRITWFVGDRREYPTHRDDEFAWEGDDGSDTD